MTSSTEEEERTVRFIRQDLRVEADRSWRTETPRESVRGSREEDLRPTPQDLEALVGWRWRSQLRSSPFLPPPPPVFNPSYQELAVHCLLMHLKSLRQMLHMHLEEGLNNQRISDLEKVRSLSQDVRVLETALLSTGLGQRISEEERWITIQGTMADRVVRITLLKPE